MNSMLTFLVESFEVDMLFYVILFLSVVLNFIMLPLKYMYRNKDIKNRNDKSIPSKIYFENLKYGRYVKFLDKAIKRILLIDIVFIFIAIIVLNYKYVTKEEILSCLFMIFFLIFILIMFFKEFCYSRYKKIEKNLKEKDLEKSTYDKYFKLKRKYECLEKLSIDISKVLAIILIILVVCCLFQKINGI